MYSTLIFLKQEIFTYYHKLPALLFITTILMSKNKLYHPILCPAKHTHTHTSMYTYMYSQYIHIYIYKYILNKTTIFRIMI